MRRLFFISLAVLALCGCGDNIPTQSPTASISAPPGPPIFDLLSLMGKTPKQVKRMLRLSYLSDQYRMTEGDPYPGELEMVFLHAKGQFPEMDLAFDGNDRCHFVAYNQIDSYGYTFDQYVPLLDRLGIPIDTPPDVDAPAGRNWTNWRGYEVHVFGEGTPEKIWQVQIEKAGAE